MGTRLYVGNLPFSTTTEDLQSLFSEVGPVAAVELVQDKFTGRSRGFAFVDMAEQSGADTAVQKFNGHDMAGRALVVNEARPREERAPRSFGGGGGGGGGGFRERRGGGGGGGGYRGGGGGGGRGGRGGGGGGGRGGRDGGWNRGDGGGGGDWN